MPAEARHAARLVGALAEDCGPVHRRLLTAFGVATTTGDIAALTRLLREDAVLLANGGGKVTTALNPIRGAGRIARFFVGIARKFGPAIPDLRAELRTVNGIPAIVARAGTRIEQVIMLSIENERIAAVYAVRNPDRLAAAGP